MYQTSTNVVTHEEPWATVIRIGLTETCVRICGHLAIPGEPEQFPIRIFDQLTSTQKIAMLSQVGLALLSGSTPAPELTAVVEATTATILDVFVEALIVEADANGNANGRECTSDPIVTDCRAALLAILSPNWSEIDLGPLPDVNNVDPEMWESLAGSLSDMVLYDLDFEDESIYSDLPPDSGRSLKDAMGIDPNYFAALAPELTRTDLESHLAILEQLTGTRLDAGLVD